MMNKILVITFLGTLFLNASAQEMKFEYHEIDRFGVLMGQTALVDVNNDGYLDWVFGMRGEMYWYQYVSPSEWIKRELGTGAKTDVGGYPLDVNGDGWIDFVIGDSWYENTGNPENEPFKQHYKKMLHRAHDVVPADIDGDGREDIVQLANRWLVWYKMPEKFEAEWDSIYIGPGIHGGVDPLGVGDLDGDGDIDIVRGDAWFENVDGKGLTWMQHDMLIPEGGSRPDKYGLCLKSWVVDMNDDGLPDIIQAECDTQDGRVFWWENVRNAAQFVYHPISDSSTGQDFHSLAVGDFNGDGYMDVTSGGGPLTQGTHKLFIWENVNGDGSEWKEHLILEGKRVHEAVAADVDGDGDIDIVTKAWGGNLHFYLENKLVD